MHSVSAIADQIIAREGGYVNDPDDPGGATKFGVTIGTMRQLAMDLTGDGRITPADVRALRRDQARQIFIDRYFVRPGIARLPEPIQSSVFDMQVNAGTNAVRLLQRLLRDLGEAVAVDGLIGPVTAAAALRAQTVAPDHFVDAYGIARRNYYYALGDRRARLRKFARRRDGGKGGWIVRAEEFISVRYHLTDAEHRERTAAWA